jgi:hypothetical protein
MRSLKERSPEFALMSVAPPPPPQGWEPCDLYAAYTSARDETEQALADWRAARTPEKRARFTAYRAAADREDAAGFAWLGACASFDTSVRGAR